MNRVHLETLDHRTAFRPGEVVEGVAGWALDAPPKTVTVTLAWHTSGKGDTDHKVIDTVTFEDVPAVDARIYRFTLPNGPYGFSGRLITLQWSIELLVKPGKHAASVDLTVSPTGQEVRL